MAKSTEEIIQIQLGGQVLQIARLLAENEELKEQIAKLQPKPPAEPEKAKK